MKISGYRIYSDSTLLQLPKRKIIELLRVAEHNYFVTVEACNNSAKAGREIAKQLDEYVKRGSQIKVVVSCERMESGKYYRLLYHCPNCASYLRHTTHNSERMFGNSTILKENVIPEYCPFCGQSLKWTTEVQT